MLIDPWALETSNQYHRLQSTTVNLADHFCLVRHYPLDTPHWQRTLNALKNSHPYEFITKNPCIFGSNLMGWLHFFLYTKLLLLRRRWLLPVFTKIKVENVIFLCVSGSSEFKTPPPQPHPNPQKKRSSHCGIWGWVGIFLLQRRHLSSWLQRLGLVFTIIKGVLLKNTWAPLMKWSPRWS